MRPCDSTTGYFNWKNTARFFSFANKYGKKKIFGHGLAFLAISIVLALGGCGGGGGSNTPTSAPAPTPSATNQAVLGPLSGAAILAYRLTNLTTPVESVVANKSTTNLNLAGSFTLSLAGIPATEWILVTATGGQDIDANDDGIIDAVPSANAGTIHALATAADWRKSGSHINILTELAWQGVQAAVTAGNTTALPEDLKWASLSLVRLDINGDGVVDYKDLLAFIPSNAVEKEKLGFVFKDIFSLDGTGKSLMDYFEADDVAGVAERVRGLFGTRLVAPKVPALVNTIPNVILPVNAEGVVASNLTVSSFVSTTAQIQNSRVPNLLMAEDTQGKTIMLGYAMTSATVQWVIQKLGNTPATAALAAISDQTHVELSPRSTALSLVMLSIGGSVNKNARAILAARVLAHADFPALKTSIAKAIAANPRFLESIGNDPGMMASIRNLAKKVLDQYINTIGTPKAIVMAHPAPVPTLFARVTGWLGKILIKATDIMGIRESIAAIIPALKPITPTVKNNAWGGVFGFGTSPWFPDQPWNWYGTVSKINPLDPPLIAVSTGTPGTFAMGNPTDINYAMEYYVNGKYVDWLLMPRNGSMIQKAFNSGAAFWPINPPVPFDITKANHVDFYKLGNAGGASERNIMLTLHTLHLVTGLISIVADGSSLGKLVKSAEKRIGLKGATYQLLATCGASLVSAVDFNNGDASFWAANALSIGGTLVTSCVVPYAISIGEASIRQQLLTITTNAIGKLIIKVNNPVGWATMIFGAANDLAPFTAGLALADSHVGYDMTWLNGTLSSVTRNDATPQPGGGNVILPQAKILKPKVGAAGVVTFDASTSIVDASATPAYSWSFGDGTNGAGAIVTHTYATAGKMPVTLTLDDGLGHRDSVIRTYIATNGRPPVISQARCTIDPITPTQVHFSVTATDPDNDIASYQWFLNAAQATPVATTVAPALPNVVLQYPVSTITSFSPMVKVVDANGNSTDRICTTWKLSPPSAFNRVLNDTGITTWANNSINSLTVAQPLFPKQDADVGRDALARAGTLSKTGGGRAGFDFTKLDAAGQPLANQTATYATTPWSCVQDNVTGLMWEVKRPTGSGGLRDMSYTYTWYNSTGVNDGGNAGTANGGSCVDGKNCDTEKYVAAVNALTGANRLCGYTDWRLPKEEELRSIVDYSIATPGLTIDTGYFPDTISNWYWSASPYAAGAPGGAWLIDFLSGFDIVFNMSNSYHVRLVRGGQ